MDKCLYFEICIICMLIMAMMIFNLNKQYARLLEDRIFRSILWTANGLFFCDGIWVLINGMEGVEVRRLSYFLNLSYFILTGLIGELWLIYTDYRIYQDEEKVKKNHIWYAIPCTILVVLTVASPWTGWIFHINKENCYERGSYHFCQMMIAYGYLIWAAVKSLVMAHKTEKKYLKSEYKVLAGFTVLPVMGGIIQGIVYGFPLVWAGTAISLLMVFIYLQNQQISKDGLTGVNNRRYLNRYLDAKIECKHHKKKLFFVLMDIDAFKEINDTYGHIEGDTAIIRVAGILKEICCWENDFVARFGGDEFAIVCERDDYQEVENLIKKINSVIELSNSAGDMEYQIQLSIGYAEFCEDKMENQDQLIALADKRLYEMKKKRKLCDIT